MAHPLPHPSVSVIVPIYNGASDLPDLLSCLRSQTYPKAQVEYLLVDNGSRDATPHLLAQAQAQALAKGLQLHYLSESQIQSSYAARNRGIRSAQGEILAFTDADCRPQPDWLAVLIQPFADPTVGLVVGELTALPGNSCLEQYAERKGMMSQRYSLEHPFGAYGQTANLAVRSSALEQVGLFRPYLTTGGDADLCWRLQKEGEWRLAFAEAAIVQHRHRSTWPDLMSQWRRYGRSNRYLHQLYGVALQKPLDRRQVTRLLGRWLLKEIPQGVLRRCRGQGAWIDLLGTPIDLACNAARFQGQQEAHLPEEAKQIDFWVSQSIQKSSHEFSELQEG
jgi:cellulose synthase/poly-beta-1,6-N-acetylglucosamine synthase-like glycosyltransferase